MKGKEQDNNALWYIATAPPKYESLTGQELSRVFRKGIRKYFYVFKHVVQTVLAKGKIVQFGRKYFDNSRRLEAGRFRFTIFQSLWKLTGTLAVALSRYLSSNFRAMRYYTDPWVNNSFVSFDLIMSIKAATTTITLNLPASKFNEIGR